jgi:hypothetical protein
LSVSHDGNSSRDSGARRRGRAARAQQGGRVRRIGWLSGRDENDPGRNLRMDLRWGGDDINQIAALARELVGRRPDIILTGTTPATVAVQRETRKALGLAVPPSIVLRADEVIE